MMHSRIWQVSTLTAPPATVRRSSEVSEASASRRRVSFTEGSSRCSSAAGDEERVAGAAGDVPRHDRQDLVGHDHREALGGRARYGALGRVLSAGDPAEL